MGGGWIALGALLCALGVAGAAFGAHGLASRLDARSLELWEMASRYLLYGGFSLILIGVVTHQLMRRGLDGAGLSLTAGTLIFSGTLAGLAFGGPRWLGMVTPVGGSLIILGFLLFAWHVARP